MQQFAESISVVSAPFLGVPAAEIVDALCDSVVFDTFCSHLRERTHGFIAIGTKEIEGVLVVECASSVSSILNDIVSKRSNATSCVALQSRAFLQQNQKPQVKAPGADDAADELAVSDADELELDDHNDDDRLVLANVEFQTVNLVEPLNWLMNQLTDLHQPLCFSSAALVNKAMVELVNNIKAMKNYLVPLKIEKYFHPEIVQICKTSQASDEELFLQLGARASATDFVNEVFSLKKECEKEMNSLNESNFAVTSLRDEVALWQSVISWVEAAKQQTETREWKLTNLIVKKRVRESTDKVLQNYETRARDYTAFLNTIPYARMDVDDLKQLADAVRDVYMELNNFTMRRSSYPPERAAPLAKRIAADVCTKVLTILAARKDLFTMRLEDVKALLKQALEVTREANSGAKAVEESARSQNQIAGTKGRKDKEIQDHESIVAVNARVTSLLHFFDEHYRYNAAIQAVFAKSPDHASILDALKASYAEVSAIAGQLWDLSDAANEAVTKALTSYRAGVQKIDSSIIVLVKSKLSSATTAAEMFRVYDHFKPVLYRDVILSAVDAFRSHMLGLADKDIDALQQRYHDKTALRESVHVIGSRGVSKTIARLQWNLTTLRRLDDLLQKRDMVSEVGWTRLLALRDSSNLWTLDETLAQFIGVSLPKLVSASTKGVDNTAFGSAIALAFLNYAFNRDRDSWIRQVSDATKLVSQTSGLANSAESALQTLGIGAVHHRDQDRVDSYHKLRAQIQDDVTDIVREWCVVTLKKVREVSNWSSKDTFTGFVLTVKQSPDKSLYLNVHFPLFAQSVIKDETELKALGISFKNAAPSVIQDHKEIRDFLAKAEPLVAYATTLNALLTMYYDATRNCGPDVLYLLDAEHDKLQRKMMEGLRLSWAVDSVRVFVRDVSALMQPFLANMKKVGVATKRFRETLTSLAKSDPEPQMLKSWMGRLKKVSDEMGSLSTNAANWLTRVNEEIDDILVAHLVTILEEWEYEFKSLDSNSDFSNKEEKQAHTRRVHLNLQPLQVTMRVVRQQVQLEPPLVVIRRKWYTKLNEAISSVCDLPSLEIQAGTSLEGSNRGYHHLVSKLPSGKLSSVFKVIEASLTQATEHLEQWRRHQSLWDTNFSSLAAHLKTDIPRWTFLVKEVRGAYHMLADAEQVEVPGIQLSTGEVQKSISAKYAQMSSELLQRFANVLNNASTELHKLLAKERESLELKKVSRMDDALKLLCDVPRLEELLAEWDAQVPLCVQGQALLYDGNTRMVDLPKNWLDAERVENEYMTLKTLFAAKRREVDDQKDTLQEQVEGKVKAVGERIDRLTAAFRAAQLDKGGAQVRHSYAEVTKLFAEAQKIKEDANECALAQQALGMADERFTSLNATVGDIEGLHDVYTALVKIQDDIDALRGIRFSSVDPRREHQALKTIEQRLTALPPSMHTYDAVGVVVAKIRSLVSMGTIINDLRSDAMSHKHHWEKLCADLGLSQSWLNELTLGAVWDADPIAHGDKFKAVIATAQGEMVLEAFLGGIRKYWDELLLDFASFQGKVNLVRGWDTMFEKLTEHLGSMASMKLSPHYERFKADANAWDETLNRVRRVMEALVDVQRRWVYLEGIFGASADIRLQLPGESSLFEKTSREFFSVMPKPKANQALTVVRFASGDKLLGAIERIARELTMVQRALGDYLEKQRASFARFYFVGDEDLLEVIGNGKSPILIAKHLRKMFGGIAALTIEDEMTITAMQSSETELVKLSEPINTTDVRVNDWLGHLARGMVTTLALDTHAAVADFKNDPATLIAWIDKYPNQVACLALQLAWTQAVEAAMAKNVPVATVADTMSKYLEVLAGAVLAPDLGAILRTKIEQIITVSVYQRDSSRVLSDAKATADGFEWLSRIRCYLTDDRKTKGVECRMADATFAYSFEYLGIADRLVQTPLTDKCYLTLTQALHTKLGGSPSGPAGTGKTETVKALGAQLGRFVLVFCCDESFDFKSMGRIFVGLCQVGAWGCFDEFNRLEERILSAVSQQIQTIQEGLRDAVTDLELVDRRVSLHKDVGVFITMNPGYAGRSNLPDNLKQLFRPVAMTAPDRENIAEVMLFAQGFRTAEVLSRKIVPLFKLCKDQLSPQSHYDFGLRAMKSVLISAGALKRAATASGKGAMSAADETNLMIQSLTETMVPKLIASDVALFYPLLRDVFPGFDPEATPLTSLRAAIKKHCDAKGFVMNDDWTVKIEQLYKILQVNHGVMLVGGSGTGKTAAWTTLLHALADLEDIDGHAYVIDPKALTKQELYGVLDNTTREWRDGVFTATLRRLVDNIKGDDQSKKRHWILFDGDVDPEWVENLNSLLDDNRLLTLPNGERLALPPNVRIVFEVQDLRYATLATVSRCGMVWFSQDVMPISNYVAELKHTLLTQPLRGFHDHSSHFAERRSAREQKKSNNAADRTAEQLAQLQVQRAMFECVAGDFEPAGLVERSVVAAEGFLSSKGIMEWNSLQALRAMFALFGHTAELLQQRNDRSGAMDAEVMKLYVRRRLAFSIAWGLASGCSIDNREQFAKHLGLPDGPTTGSIFDCDVSVDDGKWIEWRKKVPSTELPAQKVGTNDVVIPTVDTARHEAVIAAWLHSGKPIILCGPPGSGKTMSLTAVLRSSPDYDCAFLNFSSATNSHAVLKLLEEYATYKNTMHGMVLTPISGKKLIIFCDEINLPSADKYGTQQVVQLLRQLTERNGFFRAKDNMWIALENIQFAGACNPPTDPGRTPMSHRFLRWAPVLFVDFPSYESLIQIYNTYCRALLKKNPRLRAISDCLAKAMVDSYKGSQTRFTPDIQRHYVYSPRELSRWSRAIFEGITSLEEPLQMTMTTEQLVRLAVHEGLRLFRDRLTLEEEQQWTDKHIDTCFINAFPGLDRSCLQRPLLFTTILTRAYTSVNVEDLRKHTQERLKMFADEELDVQLVVFDSMLDHVIRIDRVLRQPLGHMLLAGASGVGKTVLSKFAAWLSNMSVFQIKAHRGYTLRDFEDDLRTIMRRAGCKRERIVFLFDESNIMDSGFLEYMNALLASAEVPGLFEGDEWTSLMHQIRDGIAHSGQTEHVDQTVETELYRWFISQVAANLHVIFTMNPANAEFHNRAATSPALFNRCTIDWFGDWNMDSMITVARELTRRVDVQDSNPGKFVDVDAGQVALSTCIYRMHSHVHNLNERLRAQAGNRGTFITPRHFLDFISHFLALFKEKRSATQELQRHLNGGLSKLRDTAERVNEQQSILREKDKVLAESSAKATEMLAKLVDEKSKAEKAKKAAEELAVQLAEESKTIEAQKAEAEAQLSQAQPALDEAAAALSTIKKDDLREIRAYATPPPMVKKVLEAVITVLGEKKANDWDVIKTYTRREDFVPNVQAFKPSNLTDELKEKVKKNFVNTPDFTYEVAQRASRATGPLVKWVIAQVRYADIHISIKPLTESIERLSAAFEEKAAALEAAKSEVAQFEATLTRLQNDYSDLMQQNSAIKAEISQVMTRCARATALMENLTAERIRWESQAANFRTELTSVLGDCLVGGAFLAYIGYYDEQIRKRQILPEWYDIIDASKIEFRHHMVLTEFLSRPEKRMQWAANKLPQDDLCIENAIILDRYRRYPLIVDPSGQAADFLAAEYASKKLTKTSFLDKNFMKLLEQCVRFGTPVLVQDVEHIDPVLNPLLNKEVRKVGGRNLIRLGAQDIDISPTFNLILTTRDASFQFAPDVTGRVTMINFTVTPSVLQSQVLHLVLQHERPDIEQKRSDLMKLQGEYALRLRVLEDELLTAIASSEGEILENETLIQTLETLKKEVALVTSKMQSSATAFADIHAVEDQVSPIASVASRLFFSLDQLSKLCSTYHFSLRFFFGVVEGAFADLPAVDFGERLRYITRNLFGLLNIRVSRSMYHADHLAWHLRLAQLRCGMNDNTASVPSQWWDLITGSTAVADASTLPNFVPSSTPAELKSCLAALVALPSARSLLDSFTRETSEWERYVKGDGSVPASATAGLDGAASAFLEMLVAKVLRPSAFTQLADKFVTELFDRSQDFSKAPPTPFLNKDHLYDIDRMMPELDASTPLLLLSTPGYDASQKVELLARREKKRLRAVAMGSAEAFDEAAQALATALQTGAWVLLKNVHLCAKWLDDLEKRLHAGRLDGTANAEFRIFLAAETSDKLPRSLIGNSRVLTFEPPPGIKSNLTRTFVATVNSLPQYPNELTRLCFVVAWLHAVVVERTRYVPLGWSKKYEFSEGDFHRSISTVIAWVNMAANGRHNVSPTDLPWTAIRRLICETVYGGKIDNPCDDDLIRRITDRYLSPEVFSPKFAFEGKELTCGAFAKADILQWITNLVDVEPPEWLGLPASATIMVLEQAAAQAQSSLQAIQLSALSADVADASTGEASAKQSGPVWVGKLKTILVMLTTALPNTNIPMIASVQHDDSISLVLQREIRFGNKTLDRVRADIRELTDVTNGAVKPTNNARGLVEKLLRDEVPPAWRPYTLLSGISLAAWASDLSFRVATLTALSASGNRTTFVLGAFFNPGAVVTATRQSVARRANCSLEELHLVGSFTPSSDPLSFRVQDVTLVGAEASTGALTLSSASGTTVDVSLLWTRTKPEGAGLISLPLYLNEQRADVLAFCPVPLADSAKLSSYVMQGVCLTAWRRR